MPGRQYSAVVNDELGLASVLMPIAHCVTGVLDLVAIPWKRVRLVYENRSTLKGSFLYRFAPLTYMLNDVYLGSS